jgi:hypothetical protein
VESPDAATILYVADSGTKQSDVPAPPAPTIADNGLLTIDAGAYALIGNVGDFAGGNGGSMSLTYGSSSFCLSGTVPPNSTYQSFAGVGFGVAETQTPTGGQVTTLPLTATSITVNFANYDGSPLRFQLSSINYQYWCYDLTGASSPITIPLTSFNTACWDNSGQAFVSGTGITELQFNVPGSNTSPTPYDFCMLGLSIQ